MKRMILAAAYLLAAACTPQKSKEAASLEALPAQLTFSATDAPEQNITVKAVNTTWKHTLAEEDADWIEITRKDDSTLAVSVANNLSDGERRATIHIESAESGSVTACTVEVVQDGLDKEPEYSISVNPASLTFEAEGAYPQEVKVTAEGEGLTWKAAIEPGAEEWIKVAEKGDGFTVSVADNPQKAERAANIIVTPDNPAAKDKAVRVIQKELVLSPSMSIELDTGAAPEDGFLFDYIGRGNHQIKVTSVNLSWSLKVQYDSGGEADWIKAETYVTGGLNQANITVSENKSEEMRTGLIILTTDAEGIGPFEVKVAQEGKPEFVSTVTEDVDFGTLTESRVVVYPNNDRRDLPYTSWDLRLWSADMEFTGSAYKGSGQRMNIKLATDPLRVNDEGVYYLPDGTYTVLAEYDKDTVLEAGDIMPGTTGYYDKPDFPSGTWYSRMKDDAYTGRACISEGTVQVIRQGEIYTLTFSLKSDASYYIQGSFEGEFNLKVQ